MRRRPRTCLRSQSTLKQTCDKCQANIKKTLRNRVTKKYTRMLRTRQNNYFRKMLETRFRIFLLLRISCMIFVIQFVYTFIYSFAINHLYDCVYNCVYIFMNLFDATIFTTPGPSSRHSAHDSDTESLKSPAPKAQMANSGDEQPRSWSAEFYALPKGSLQREYR